MTLVLCGGGPPDDAARAAIGDPFLTAVLARTGGARRAEVAIVSVHAEGQDPSVWVDAFGAVARIPEKVDARPLIVPFGTTIQGAAFDGVDGVVVCGGLTPEYHRSLQPAFPTIRALVDDGVPYLGFSAGAMIAADVALLGGWRVGAVEVSPEDWNEDLEQVTLAPGIGLLRETCEVHAAQTGLFTRLVGAVEAGLLPGGVAVDEDTALVLDGDRRAVVGTGAVRRVERAGDGVLVTRV